MEGCNWLHAKNDKERDLQLKPQQVKTEQLAHQSLTQKKAKEQVIHAVPAHLRC